MSYLLHWTEYDLMHLDAIKLAGFKSFADPTTIKFQSNLTAIVGPNGCGKSNVVDAIRWVIGESSAKNLRAESMADVIFNGTTNRKPLGQSSIELSFDNSDGAVKGEYAGYSNISVRRILQRDGQSTYYLNNTRCRRKDILDVFLGTGLGPRSYSIIEQGMISKIIEAKPEELRVYLEEAAGISKYKERRRETENRIRHTQDNLDRLNDLREELESQLSKLKRQANAAERYKTYKAELRQTKAELDTIEWKNLHDKWNEIAQTIKEEELAIEALITDQRRHDTNIEQLKIQQTDATDEFNTVQSRFYSHGTEIAKLEQQINHAEERIKQINDDLRRSSDQLSDIESHLETDKEQLEAAQKEINSFDEICDEHKSISQKSQQTLIDAEEKLQEWQDTWDTYQSENAQTLRQVEVEQTKVQHAEQRVEQLNTRKTRISEQANSIVFQEIESEISSKSSHADSLKARLDQIHHTVEENNATIQHQREAINTKRTKLDDINAQLQRLAGKQSSLEALQQAALGKNDGEHESWLERFNLANNTRLAESIRVEEAWTKAVETVLGEHLEAICVNDINSLKDKLENIGDINLCFYNTNASNQTAGTKGVTLASKINTELSITPLLLDVYIAESLEEAYNLLPSLSPNESVITKEGIWINPYWVKIHGKKDEKTGVIQRQEELSIINADLKELHAKQTELQTELDSLKEKLHKLEEQRDQKQSEYRHLSNEFSDAQSQLSSKQTQYQQQKERAESLTAELNELKQQYSLAEEECREAKERLNNAQRESGVQLERKQELVNQRDNLKYNVQEARQKAELDKQKFDELHIRLEATRNQVRYLQQGIDRAETQKREIINRNEHHANTLNELESPLPDRKQELQRLLTQQVEVEKDLTVAKQQLGEIEDELRQKEKSRHSLENQIQELRSEHENARVQQETCKVKCETLETQIREAEFDKETILSQLDENVNPQELRESVESLETKIQRLGAINLAAIEEHEQTLERKEYLDRQHDDLVEALETLQTAIRKIDKETKSKFKDTYDEINKTLQEYFPKIFGGGHACLELTDEDLLNTGVIVKAQPPGKKNTTIHLLSGGEKALTAIALVFSFFQLNPAPFCVLDEVDAPLDDANVNRFCNLVKSMSDKVQFIIISHNKITIELANQLAGVTMQEPGVSRLVQVDIDEAIAMVDE